MTAALLPPRTGLEAYQMLPEGTYCQLINDHIIMSPAPLLEHQWISQNINSQLFYYVKINGLGEVYYAPVDVYLNNSNIFQPDLLYISNQNLPIKKANGIFGPPDLVIEILSKGTNKYDKVEKKEVYETSGVKEYWIIHPIKKTCQGFILKDGVFENLPITKNGFTIRMFDLFIQL